MRDEWLDTAFESELRAAMRLELATVRVGVAAPQVRGRIAARERGRRAMRLVLLAAGLAAALLGGLVLAGQLLAPPPSGDAEPATVAAIDASTGDLVVSRAWPDERLEVLWRFPRAIDRVREATGDPNATQLPHGAVAVAGPDGWLAIALPGDDILYFRRPAAGATEFVSGAIGGDGGAGSFGWTADGRIVTVGGNASARLVASFFDPATGVETSSPIPAGVVPDWTRGDTPRLTWTGDGRIVAERGDTTTFEGEIGSLDLSIEPPTFAPGLPASIRAHTGTELRYAADGSWPGSGCQDGNMLSRCAGLSDWTSQRSAPDSTWYVTRADEALDPAPVRTADGTGLLAIARGIGADRGRLLVIDAPGSWREAFEVAAPAFDPGNIDSYWNGATYPAGVAPDGRSVAVWTPSALVVGDLSTGEHVTLPAGTVFVGWPTAPVVETDRLATLAACESATPEDAAAVALSAAGIMSPASAGVQPVVGERQDTEPFRRDELADAPAVQAEVDGLLTLALPAGTCAEAAIIDAVRAGSAPGAATTSLGTWPAGSGTVGGLVPVAAPPAGDWVVRVRLWLDGADREAILLYHVTVPEPADADGTGTDTSSSPEP
jgi:hypothetical protein